MRNGIRTDHDRPLLPWSGRFVDRRVGEDQEIILIVADGVGGSNGRAAVGDEVERPVDPNPGHKVDRQLTTLCRPFYGHLHYIHSAE